MKTIGMISVASVAALGFAGLSVGTAFAAGGPVITGVTAPSQTSSHHGHHATIQVSVVGLTQGGFVQLAEESDGKFTTDFRARVKNASETFVVPYRSGATAVEVREVTYSKRHQKNDTAWSSSYPIPISSPGGPTLPGPQGDYFDLTHFSAKPVSGQPRTYTLDVTVEQYQSDPDDYTFRNPTTETHKFPSTVPVTWDGGTVDAHLQAGAGTLTYSKHGSGTVSASAQYSVTFPTGLKSTTNLSIGPFYMVGPVQPNSKDDIVYGTAIPIPYGQLPEVPWAAMVPVVGLGAPFLLKRARGAK